MDDWVDEFERYVAGSSARLLRTAYLLTGDRGDAEDLLQTALVKTYRHWPRLRDREDPTAFVRRVLVTTHAGWRRRRQVSLLLGSSRLQEHPADDVPDLGERDEVLTALGQLPPRMRAVLVLRFWEDLSEAGTAEALGCAVSTVRTQTRRGLDRLRAVLEPPRADAPASDPSEGARR